MDCPEKLLVRVSSYSLDIYMLDDDGVLDFEHNKIKKSKLQLICYISVNEWMTEMSLSLYLGIFWLVKLTS